ncbi:hypothetical protein [Absidia glauca]|uniref:Ndc10 domain-containing protein n=1 Tax=Absidia glauca TaxID=4829 RepID=A0A168Q275_ABSGL|nr:hypothetical protein [Absidia glauca]
MKGLSHQPSKKNDAINDRLPPPMVDPFTLPMPPLIHLPASARKLSPDNNNPIQPTSAANEFVQVVMMLRKTSIQDSVLMMELHPCHPIWQHSIFSDPAYLPFKRQANTIALESNSMLTLIC